MLVGRRLGGVVRGISYIHDGHVGRGQAGLGNANTGETDNTPLLHIVSY